MLGKSMFEYVHPDDFDNVFEIVRKALVAGTTAKFEYRCRHADGHYVWLESGGNPIFDEKGQMIGAVLSSREITERKRMEEELKKQNQFLKTILESLTYPFYVVDVNDYSIRMSNSAAGFKITPEKATCHKPPPRVARRSGEPMQIPSGRLTVAHGHNSCGPLGRVPQYTQRQRS
jgi:transcriptional regulator with PAS, ATPase and Fis domain